MKLQFNLAAAFLATLMASQPADSAAVINISAVSRAILQISLNDGAAAQSVQDNVILTQDNPSKVSTLRIRTNVLQWHITAQAVQDIGDLGAISLDVQQASSSGFRSEFSTPQSLSQFRTSTVIVRGNQPTAQKGDSITMHYALSNSSAFSGASSIVRYRIDAEL